jgi:hypothetical protein
VNQGLNKAMVGVVKELVAVLEGRTRGDTGGDESAGSGEKKRGIGVASGAVTRNASVSGAGVVTVLQVPPPAARCRNREQYACPWGWGWADNQEPSKKQLGPIDDIQRSFLSSLSVNLFISVFK